MLEIGKELSNFSLSAFNNLAKFYGLVRRQYIKSLPQCPLNLRITQPIFKILTKSIMNQFEPSVIEELNFYIKNHYELQDLQDGRDMGHLLTFIKDNESVKGDILELGSYKGGTTIMIAHFLKKIKSVKKVFACDAFIGLPYDDKFSTRAKNSVGMFSDTSAKLVLDKFRKFEVDDKIQLLEGLFEDTLNEKLTNSNFSIVLIDCDLYDATKYCLEFVYPRLNKNGLIILDDYQNLENPEWGETKAADEFCSSYGTKVILSPMSHIVK